MIFYKVENYVKGAGAAHGLAAGVPPLRRTLGLQENE